MTRHRLPALRRIAAATALVIALIGVSGASQEAPEAQPPWVIYQEGLQQLRDQELGPALESFRRAIRERGGAFPEAEAGIGRVFAMEGQLDLATQQFRRALDQEAFLYIPAQRYAIRYELAELHDLSGAPRLYRETLEELVAENPSFSDPENASLRASYLDTLRENGIDRLLVLYRLEENFARQAHALLGYRYLDDQRYDAALEHLTFASLMVFSTVIDELRRFEPEYEFETLSGLFARLERRSRLREYLSGDAEAYRLLFRLADALAGADPQPGTALEIYRFLAETPDAGQWSGAARRRLGG